MSFHTAAQRREQQRSDARRAILAAAESILVEDGYEQFSMRRLAERCGYTAPTIYHYFGDKLGLLDAVLETRFRELLRTEPYLFGPGDHGEPTAQDWAETLDTINYEVVTGIRGRVRRTFAGGVS